MNKYLYKYMPLREQFFVEPMLRATQIEGLNDPFEASLAMEQIVNVMKHQDNVFAPDGYEKSEDEDNYHIQACLETIPEDLNEQGIVSFTEDYSNLLMWSHYADEHQGIVIEIENDHSWLDDKDFIENDKFVRFAKSPVCNMHELPTRVVYRDTQPMFELERDALPDDKYSVPYKKLIKSLFLTKGDKWIYEKEHRSILNLRYCDKLITDYSDHLEIICNGQLTIQGDKKEKCEINIPSDFDVGENEDVNGDGIRLGLYGATRYTSKSLYLYKVDPMVITGVYFGCNVPDYKIKKCIELIRNNSNFREDLILKKAVARKDRYALSFEEIKI
ncbi:DUF2971 domain-containing protein [Photobacterium iliopiscarium]|uniref:DUF2971 domain-containing protein n=1 Tax=Photobacterium iliopiscarium TaxID=56192 RepID=UPI000AA8D730|nr:DUF2971 domain-containing protein [Photobacterium iliopiscarium]